MSMRQTNHQLVDEAPYPDLQREHTNFAMMIFPDNYVDVHDVLVSSVCSTTMVKDRHLLTNIIPLSTSVKVTGNFTSTLEAKELCMLQIGTLKVPALYIPTLARNFLSVGQTASVGGWGFDGKGVSFTPYSGNPPITAPYTNGVPCLTVGKCSTYLIQITKYH